MFWDEEEGKWLRYILKATKDDLAGNEQNEANINEKEWNK